MRFLARQRLLPIPFLMLAFPILASAQLENLRAVYDRALEQIVQEHAVRAKGLPNLYAKSLDNLETVLTSAGDLAGVLAVREEKTILKSGRPLPQRPQSDLHPEVRRLRGIYQKTIADNDLNRNNQIVTLTERYSRRLEELERALTTQGKIEEAIAVNAERKGLSQKPEVTAAKFAIADATAQPAPPPPAPSPSSPASRAPTTPPPSEPASSPPPTASRPDSLPHSMAPMLSDGEIERIGETLKKIWPSVRVSRTRTGGLSVDVIGAISSLDPVRGMPLAHLRVFQGKITDLSPLQGMPLDSLVLHNCRGVASLEPLRGMSLTTLHLFGCERISDLSPVKGMPIRKLVIAETGVTDLTPLEGMPLQELSFSPARILRGMDTVRSMSMSAVRAGWGGGPSALKAYPSDQFWKLYDQGEFKNADGKK